MRPTFWGELKELIRSLHQSMYERIDAKAAKREIPKIRRLIEELPTEIEAILHAEALAIYHELIAEKERALVYRELEITLMKKLHADVIQNNYDQATREYILQDRTIADLQVRQRIAENLRR